MNCFQTLYKVTRKNANWTNEIDWMKGNFEIWLISLALKGFCLEGKPVGNA
jgi:hypothetical protein